MTRNNYHALAIVMVTGLTTYLHYTTMQTFSPHTVLEELYYIPLLLGVLRFKPKGAIATYLFVSAAYIPFFFSPWATTFTGYMDRVLHLVFSGAVMFVAGFLAERERRNRTQAERDRYLAVIGQVATVIVHDLKNPLISIQGFARRIQEGKGDYMLAAATITESAQTMQRIVNDVLDFAKPLQLDLKEGDIGDAVRRAGESCRGKAEEVGIALVVNPPAEPVVMGVDHFYIERALINLISNAVEASHKGAQVVITAAAGKNELVISIKDYGAGMDRETLENIFTPFYTTKNEGTGLGMPISKKIVEEHAGTLTITSKQGAGTEVTVRLPLGKMRTAGSRKQK